MDIITKPVVYGLAVTVFGMALWIAYLSVVNATLKTDLTIAKADLAVFTNANHELKASIEKQEAAFAKARLEATRRAAVIAKNLEAAKQKAKQYESYAQKISKIKRTGNECRDTRLMVEKYLKDRK